MYDVNLLQMSFWVIFALGIICGIMLTRVWDHFTAHEPPKAGFHKCRDCGWIYFRDNNGRWSTAVFDENAVPFPRARLGMYDDAEFSYQYADCAGKLKKMRNEVQL